MNMKMKKSEKDIAGLFKVLGAPFRVQLLYALGEGEACVCHLETILHRRQAYISQHLMVLRDAGILDTRREGKYVYYRIVDPEIFTLFEQAAAMLGYERQGLPMLAGIASVKTCCCPHCEEERVTHS